LFAVFFWRRGLLTTDPVVGTIGYSLIAACAASLIAMVVSAPRENRLKAGLAHPALVTLGTYSYGLYVFHHIVVIMLRDKGLQVDLFPGFMGSQMPGLVAFSVVAMTGSYVLAYVSWHAWEMPFLRLKRFFEYRQPPTVVDRAVPGAMGGVGVSEVPRSLRSEDVG
jgi:peptidoglycan/LPS O-acetylase OafA/YrhL